MSTADTIFLIYLIVVLVGVGSFYYFKLRKRASSSSALSSAQQTKQMENVMQDNAQKFQRTNGIANLVVAGELCRRGYTVSFVSNGEGYGISATTPGGAQFFVAVSGLKSRSSWIVKKREKVANLYYILAVVDMDDRRGDVFFILTQDEINREIDTYMNAPKRDGSAKSSNAEGFNYGQVENEAYKENWAKLPA